MFLWIGYCHFSVIVHDGWTHMLYVLIEVAEAKASDFVESFCQDDCVPVFYLFGYWFSVFCCSESELDDWWSPWVKLSDNQFFFPFFLLFCALFVSWSLKENIFCGRKLLQTAFPSFLAAGVCLFGVFDLLALWMWCRVRVGNIGAKANQFSLSSFLGKFE